MWCTVCTQSRFNLLSVSKLEEKGFKISFQNGKACVHNGSKILLEATKDKEIFEIKLPYNERGKVASLACDSKLSENNLSLWRCRYDN